MKSLVIYHCSQYREWALQILGTCAANNSSASDALLTIAVKDSCKYAISSTALIVASILRCLATAKLIQHKARDDNLRGFFRDAARNKIVLQHYRCHGDIWHPNLTLQVVKISDNMSNMHQLGIFGNWMWDQMNFVFLLSLAKAKIWVYNNPILVGWTFIRGALTFVVQNNMVLVVLLVLFYFFVFLFLLVGCPTASKAFFRSSRISSISSIPTESLTRLSCIPSFSLSSGETDAWVIMALGK